MSYKLSRNSEAILRTVKTPLQLVVRRALELSSVDFSVIEGIRSKERQAKLVSAGASQTMSSKHITGDAVDLCPYIGGKLAWEEEEAFEDIADAMRSASLELKTPVIWGRAWLDVIGSYKTAGDGMAAYVNKRRAEGRKPFLDGPHFELAMESK